MNETEKIAREAAKATKSKEPPPARNRLEDFPPANQNGEAGIGARVIAHNGLSAEERETAKRLGYDLRDVRFIPGRLGAELTMLGVRQRTVVLDDVQARIILKEIEAYGKADSAIGQGSEAEKTVGGDVASFFEGLGTASSGVGSGAAANTPIATAGVPEALPPPSPVSRGRPKGSKDKKPRAKRGSVISRDSQDALEAAIGQMTGK